MTQTPLHELLARFHRLFRDLSPEATLEILGALAEQEMQVAAIAELIGRERSQVSRQLSVLSDAGLVEWRGRGKQHRYRLSERVRIEFERGGVWSAVFRTDAGNVRLEFREPSEDARDDAGARIGAPAPAAYASNQGSILSRASGAELKPIAFQNTGGTGGDI